MKTINAVRLWTPALLIAAMAWSLPVQAQVEAPVRPPKPGVLSIEAINADYRRELHKLEQQRLERLGQFAAGQSKEEADATYHDYFRLAIAKGLYAEAEPVAERLLRAGQATHGVLGLAQLVNIVAEADRGDYEESLKNLTLVVQKRAREVKPGEDPGRDLGLPPASRAAIVDAYYQKLTRGGRYDIAAKAMKLVADNAEIPAVRDLAARRAKQLALVGLPASPIVGTDVDGKPFRSEDARGDVILVVFWATWCLPVAQEMPWLDQAYRTYQGRGFRIVGINLDAAQESGTDPRTTEISVRRFLLDFNVPWPTLMNGPGDRDYARMFEVAEIPANVLIGRDGKVAQLDLSGPRLEKAIAEAIGRRP